MTKILDKVLVDDWRQFYKFISMWAALLVGLLPSILDLAVEFQIIDPSKGSMSEFSADLVRYLAFVVAVSRLIRQTAQGQNLLPEQEEVPVQ